MHPAGATARTAIRLTRATLYLPSAPLAGITKTPNFICARAGLPKTSFIIVYQPLTPSSASCGTTAYSTRAGHPSLSLCSTPRHPQTAFLP